MIVLNTNKNHLLEKNKNTDVLDEIIIKYKIDEENNIRRYVDFFVNNNDELK